MSVLSLLSTPFSDISWLVTPVYRVLPLDSHCSRIQMKFIDCIDAYGLVKGKEKCRELFFDLSECNDMNFQMKRYRAIQTERMRQYRAGKISKPFEEHPPLDSFLYLT